MYDWKSSRFLIKCTGRICSKHAGGIYHAVSMPEYIKSIRHKGSFEGYQLPCQRERKDRHCRYQRLWKNDAPKDYHGRRIRRQRTGRDCQGYHDWVSVPASGYLLWQHDLWRNACNQTVHPWFRGEYPPFRTGYEACRRRRIREDLRDLQPPEQQIRPRQWVFLWEWDYRRFKRTRFWSGGLWPPYQYIIRWSEDANRTGTSASDTPGHHHPRWADKPSGHAKYFMARVFPVLLSW